MAPAEGGRPEKPLVVSFTAPWCKPCQGFKPTVADSFARMERAGAECHVIDVDVEAEMFAFLRTKRCVSGLPSVIAYLPRERSTSDWHLPEHVVTGADEDLLRQVERTVIMASRDSRV